eukprot:137526-Prymnesium_polylepis.1
MRVSVEACQVLMLPSHAPDTSVLSSLEYSTQATVSPCAVRLSLTRLSVEASQIFMLLSLDPETSLRPSCEYRIE